MRLTAAGIHTKAVAATLGCAAKTVEEYWKRMFQKIAQGSRQTIVAMVVAEALATSGNSTKRRASDLGA